MREILFRGKRVDNGEWETGSLVVTRMWCSDESVFIADKMTGVYTPVDSKTVGQYTGLKDKNGTRIFEGDIISAYFDDDILLGGEKRLTVCWYDYGWHGKTKYDYDTLECDWVNEYFEVIGNIHDNPELLEGE